MTSLLVTRAVAVVLAVTLVAAALAPVVRLAATIVA
jgi:hypothetical protein